MSHDAASACVLRNERATALERSPTMKKPRHLAILAWVGAMAWAPGASATPDFPGAVEQYLRLPSGTLAAKVDPPCGCPLCHVNGCAGGPPLTDFGTLMQANGAVPFQAAQTAAPALAAIEAQEPQLITDLQAGTDPDLDPSLSAAGGVRYGCALVPGGDSTPPSGVAPLGAVFAFLVCRHLGTRRSRSARFRRAAERPALLSRRARRH
jgi:hypothetical protein